MKRFAGYIDRPKSLLRPEEKLEHLYTLRDFPVFMGCVNTPESGDLGADMIWNIGTETGIIQLGKLLPLEVLYLDQHNDGVGAIWQGHYKAFANFLAKYDPKSVLEIGGAHDHIYRYFKEAGEKARWTTIEPNPAYIRDSEIRVIKGWFDDTFSLDIPVDTVVHSHVFEHTYDPLAFMQHVGKFLKTGDRHVFSFPNMVPMLERKFTNCLNFEHTAFLTEEVTEYILARAGFKVIGKEYYGDPHSIFYATEKVEEAETPAMAREYERNKKLFIDYIEYHLAMSKELNEKIDAATEPVYLFGAHIFSQTLIQFGLKADKIAGLLDNSEIKRGKRLYGTQLVVRSPEVLKGRGRVSLILKAGIYNEEIKRDILENINPEVIFW